VRISRADDCFRSVKRARSGYSFRPPCISDSRVAASRPRNSLIRDGELAEALTRDVPKYRSGKVESVAACHENEMKKEKQAGLVKGEQIDEWLKEDRKPEDLATSTRERGGSFGRSTP
jgi:hypothetical protein